MFKKIIFIVSLSLFSSLAFAAPVDINSASAETISKQLKGIGPSKAAAIVKYRDTNGPFRSVEELLKVKGIGKSTLERNRDDIQFASDKELASD